MKFNLPFLVIAAAMVLFVAVPAPAATIAIVESQSINPQFNQDIIWLEVAQGMGHTATIYPQSFLDDGSQIQDIDLLIVSSGVINLPQYRRNVIKQYLQAGKPVYLQCEYDENLASNQTWVQIVNQMGGNFQWTGSVYQSLNPMQVTGPLSFQDNIVYSFSHFLYGCHGVGGPALDGNLLYGGYEYGWFFNPSNSNFGLFATNTDRNWIIMQASPELMENYITNLLLDEPTSMIVNLTPTGSTAIPATGGLLHADVVISNPGTGTMRVDAWTRLLLPNGSLYGPLIYRTDKVFPAGYSVGPVELVQNIPYYAPSGTYEFQVVVGDLETSSIYVVDSFEFQKLAAAADGEPVNGWDSSGFDFAAVASDDAGAAQLPGSFEVGNAYPNPFNPSTSLELALPEAMDVNVAVYDIQGRAVAMLADGRYPAGAHTLSFNARGLASGVYFLQVRAGSELRTRKLILMQ